MLTNNKILVDATWSLWSSWSNCSMICSTGNHTRTRSCNTPRFGGFRACPKEGDYYETQNGCNTQSCPCENWEILKMHFLLIVKTGNGHEIEFQMLEMHFFTRSKCFANISRWSTCRSDVQKKDCWNIWSKWVFFAFCLTCQMAKVFSI